jgi:hypothetical protein
VYKVRFPVNQRSTSGHDNENLGDRGAEIVPATIDPLSTNG